MCIEEEYLCRRRRKTRECLVEAHSGVQCAVRRIKKMNKEE
jgi:hypothetical protein